MKKITVPLILLAVLSACAKRPDTIVPVDIPMAAYSNKSCGALRNDLANEKSKLAALSASQNSAATGDALGVFLIGVPVSSLGGGDQEGNIAVSKGKVQSMELTLQKKGCRY